MTSFPARFIAAAAAAALTSRGLLSACDAAIVWGCLAGAGTGAVAGEVDCDDLEGNNREMADFVDVVVCD